MSSWWSEGSRKCLGAANSPSECLNFGNCGKKCLLLFACLAIDPETAICAAGEYEAAFFQQLLTAAAKTDFLSCRV